MSSLQRYKKSGGFNQLLSLLETFGPQKREKFLEMIDAENQAWAKALREKMLSVERIFTWPDQVIIEVFKSLPLKNMAVAIHGLKEEQRAKIIGFFSASEQRKMADALGDAVKPEEVASNAVKVIELTRKMISDGHIRPEKFDEGLIIGEGIESKLESGGGAEKVKEGELNFKAIENVIAGGGGGGGNDSHAHTSVETAQMQRLLTQLSRENKQLKDENKIMKEKLDQIKRIA